MRSYRSGVTKALAVAVLTLGAFSSTGQTAGPGASVPATATPSATVPATTVPTTAMPSATIPAVGALNGTWDYLMDDGDRALLEADLESASGYNADELAIRLGFENDRWWLGFVFDEQLWLLHGVPEGDGGTFRLEDDRLITRNKDGIEVVYRWALEADNLTLTAIQECLTPTTCEDDRSRMEPMMLLVTEHTYIHSSDDPTF